EGLGAEAEGVVVGVAAGLGHDLAEGAVLVVGDDRFAEVRRVGVCDVEDLGDVAGPPLTPPIASRVAS
ncbi:MAG: hypothetical protein JXO22_12635, partial [Phycisphaerae bacterium]|nr:hypothetical protein [Phycisphaerae bacterium]